MILILQSLFQERYHVFDHVGSAAHQGMSGRITAMTANCVSLIQFKFVPEWQYHIMFRCNIVVGSGNDQKISQVGENEVSFLVVQCYD